MRKIGFLFAIVLCIAGCKSNTNEGRLKGEIKGLTSDTIYLYSVNDVEVRIDTIYAENGRFSHTFKVDTITSALLFLNKNVDYPLFLDKGSHIEIKGNLAEEFLDITGTPANEELNAFRKELKGLAKPSQKALEQKVETFVRQHNSSLASVYLLNKYFINKETPDFRKIKELTGLMTGGLLDHPDIEAVSDYVERWETVATGKPVPYFSLPNAKGEKISRLSAKLKDKYLLLTFWSCNNLDPKAEAQLRSIHRKYGKNKDFAMLGVAIDYDKEAAFKQAKKDTLSWEQVCDTTGWNSDLLARFALTDVPTHLLISPKGEIVARDIKGDSLVNKIKEVLKK